MFKVVADQLKISQGWVRCGHCSEVFDAAAHLLPLASSPVVEPAVIPAPLLREDAAPIAEVAEPLVGSAVDPVLSADPVSRIPAQEPPQPPAMNEIQVSLPPDVAADVFVSSVNPEPSDLPDPEPPVPTQARLRREVFVDSEEPDQSAHDVSFVRDARRHAFWRRAGVRIVLIILAAVLLLVLFAQVARFQRNTLAAWLPSLSPVLQAVCGPLNCEVEPAKQIESVLIDSSSFNKIAPDAYRLKVVIKNAGAIALAMPSLELTLTDTQDQALLRRILTPGELGATEGTLAAGAEFSGLVAIRISNSATSANASAIAASSPKPSSPLRIAGYRVLAFYP